MPGGSYTWTSGAITVDAQRFGKRLEQAIRLLQSPVEPLTLAGEYVLDVAYRSFSAQADPATGQPWKKLSANTIAAKGSSAPLIRTGKLRNSFQRGSTGNVWKMSSSSLTVGSRLKTASLAYRGTRRHLIRPRRATVLRFVVAGGVAFARKVTHPGTPPRRMIGLNTGHQLNIAKRLRALIVRRLGEGAA